LLIDLRLFGLSGRGRFGGKRGAVADVRGAVDEAKRLGAKKVALVGASFGGATALTVAPALGSMIDGVASLSGELRLPNADLNAIAAAPNMTVPLLVMGSRDDSYLDAADARKLMRAAGSKQKKLVEFAGTSHGWDILADEQTRVRADRELVSFLRVVTQ
jgi:dienelactone hydrolase